MLSDMALTAVMRRLGERAVPHGFRSSFTDWVADHTDYSKEMSEFALAHKVASAVREAYLRTRMREKRRTMMEEWAEYCTSKRASSNNPQASLDFAEGAPKSSATSREINAP
jgi:integrase